MVSNQESLDALIQIDKMMDCNKEMLVNLNERNPNLDPKVQELLEGMVRVIDKFKGILGEGIYVFVERKEIIGSIATHITNNPNAL